MEWANGLEPLYRESQRLNHGCSRRVEPSISLSIDCWKVVWGIQGLDSFLTQSPSKMDKDHLKDSIQYIFLWGGMFVLLSDGKSRLRVDIAHDPVIRLSYGTPEVQARWKELEQEVLRMS